jgi:SRSO17 transposase
VGRQYTGSAGKISNCPIGVFAAYVSAQGHAFIDRGLYLPKAGTADLARMRTAPVPETGAFASKPKLAAGMATRALTAGVPFSWGAADSSYGVGELEMTLRRAGKGYVLGVTAQHWFGSWHPEIHVAGEAQAIAKALPAAGWKGLSAGHGTKGERLYDGADGPLADLDADE